MNDNVINSEVKADMNASQHELVDNYNFCQESDALQFKRRRLSAMNAMQNGSQLVALAKS